MPSVGVLTLSAGPHQSIIESFRRGLRQLGYIEGQNIRVEHVYVSFPQSIQLRAGEVMR